MIDGILDILLTATQALPGSPPRAKAKPAYTRPATRSWGGLLVGLLCTAGVAGSVYWMFFQNGDLWQIAKLFLLTLIIAFLAVLGFLSFAKK